MGFAVKLVRAERAGHEFTKIYLRRTLALAVFGAVHSICPQGPTGLRPRAGLRISRPRSCAPG